MASGYGATESCKLEPVGWSSLRPVRVANWHMRALAHLDASKLELRCDSRLHSLAIAASWWQQETGAIRDF
jgi:hypothetical protein